MLKQCHKLNLRNEVVKMCVAVTLLIVFNGSANQEFKQKCQLVYWRLMDIVLKIDSI